MGSSIAFKSVRYRRGPNKMRTSPSFAPFLGPMSYWDQCLISRLLVFETTYLSFYRNLTLLAMVGFMIPLLFLIGRFFGWN